MIEIKENVDVNIYSTLGVGGKFRYFVEIRDKNDLFQVFKFAKERNIYPLILGGGSNTIFSDGIINVLALKINILGFEILKDEDSFMEIEIGAGEIWDKMVVKTIEMDLSGFETMSGIPGTIGATPVQNVGAYGSEAKDVILRVNVCDIENEEFKVLSNEDCKFSYRESVFKNEAKGKYVITSVVYRLEKNKVIIPDYPSINLDNNANLRDVREKILAVRNNKLPNPKEIPNVGSFFKNPIIDKSLIIEGMPTYDMGQKVKVPAGWLIEHAGLKGKNFGNVSVYDKNALVLINNGNATQKDFMKAQEEIKRIVKEKFNIELEQEPELI
ncbi:MAG: UDP-N-acetylmuramate dehydrogenase [Patescibacteria group bacterium]|nr:UDP-N-acetylmuramate dehydrogenase [Patescibacteria group bacterium]